MKAKYEVREEDSKELVLDGSTKSQFNNMSIKICEKLGIPYLYLKNYKNSKEFKKYRLPRDGHYSPAGSRRAAAKINEFLKKLNIS